MFVRYSDSCQPAPPKPALSRSPDLNAGSRSSSGVKRLTLRTHNAAQDMIKKPTQMVDAVIAWVDGSDPAHIRKRNEHLAGRVTSLHESYSNARFQNNGELWYCINLIRKNAPWIRNIFLITDAQCPDWLTESKRSELGVQLVDHKVLFAGHESVLPTFNSISIETILHRVPGLADRFIYFNDDFFIIRPVNESDYFDGSLPLVRGFYFSNIKVIRELHRIVSPRKFKMRGMVGTRFRQEDGVPLSRKVKVCHTPHPINRLDYELLMEQNDRVERNIQHRFRHPSQFGPIPLYVSSGLEAGKVKIVSRDDLYLDPKDDDGVMYEFIRHQVEKKKLRHMCAQSLDEFCTESRDGIKRALGDFLSF